MNRVLKISMATILGCALTACGDDEVETTAAEKDQSAPVAVKTAPAKPPTLAEENAARIRPSAPRSVRKETFVEITFHDGPWAGTHRFVPPEHLDQIKVSRAEKGGSMFHLRGASSEDGRFQVETVTRHFDGAAAVGSNLVTQSDDGCGHFSMMAMQKDGLPERVRGEYVYCGAFDIDRMSRLSNGKQAVEGSYTDTVILTSRDGSGVTTEMDIDVKFLAIADS